MRRMVENIFTGSHFHDPSGIHNAYTICNIGNHAEVMSDENYRQIVLSFHIIDQLQDSRLNRHIESCRRLIADQDLRIACKGNCNDNALPHTAGELERICLIPLCRVRNSNGFHQFDGPLLRL